MRSWLMLALLAPAACKSGETRPADRSNPPAVAAKPTETAPAEAKPTPRATLLGLERRNLSDDAILLSTTELSPAAKVSVLAEITPLAPECGTASLLAARTGDHVFVFAVCPLGIDRGPKAFALLTVTGDTARAITFDDLTAEPDPDYPSTLTFMDALLVEGDRICASVQDANETRGTEIFMCTPHAAGAAAARAEVAARPIPTTFEFGEPEFAEGNTKVSDREAIAAVKFWLAKMKTMPAAKIQQSLAKTEVTHLHDGCNDDRICLGDTVREIARAGHIVAEAIEPAKVDAALDPKKTMAARGDVTLVSVGASQFKRDGIELVEMVVAVTRNGSGKMVIDTLAVHTQLFNPDIDH